MVRLVPIDFDRENRDNWPSCWCVTVLIRWELWWWLLKPLSSHQHSPEDRNRIPWPRAFGVCDVRSTCVNSIHRLGDFVFFESSSFLASNRDSWEKAAAVMWWAWYADTALALLHLEWEWETNSFGHLARAIYLFQQYFCYDYVLEYGLVLRVLNYFAHNKYRCKESCVTFLKYTIDSLFPTAIGLLWSPPSPITQSEVKLLLLSWLWIVRMASLLLFFTLLVVANGQQKVRSLKLPSFCIFASG